MPRLDAAARYSYRVFWSPEYEEFVGVCSEFPGLTHFADTFEEALSGIRELVAFVLEDATET